MGLAEILNRHRHEDQHDHNDDLRVLRSFVEYSRDNKTLNYMIYEVEMLDKTGELRHFYKVIKVVRIIRLPKNSKQSEAFMDMHAQVLSGIWERGLNFITMIANMIDPVPLGLMFMYGIQGVAEDLETAKRVADNDFASMAGLLQGSYRTLEFRLLNYDEVEWLREKMYSMRHISVVRGLPKPREGAGVDGGNKGMGASNVNPESQDTTEQFISGMSDKEYVVQILSTPVGERALRNWLTQTGKEITRWNSQLQGSRGMNFGLTIPMMYMANMGATEGWSNSFSDAETVGMSQSESFGESYTESISQSQGVTQGTSVGQSASIGESAGINYSESESAGASRTHTEGTSYSYNEGESQSVSHSRGVSENYGFSESHSQSQGVSESESASRGQSLSTSESESVSQSASTGRSDGTSTTHGENQSQGVSEGANYRIGAMFAGAGESAANTATAGNSYAQGVNQSVSEGYATGVSQGTTQGESISNTLSQSMGRSSSVSDSVGTTASRGTSESFSESYGQTRGQSWGSSVSDSVGNSRGVSRSDGWSKGASSSEGINTSQSQSVSNTVTQGASKGTNVGQSNTDSWSRALGQSMGMSGGFNQGTSATMGVGPSISYNKTFQWLDMEVKNILTLLEFQNERLMKALNGSGAFFTDMYIATPDEESRASAQSLAKASWYDSDALICPLQVMDLSAEEEGHLLYHFNAFSADCSMEGIPGQMESYRYTTILLPDEYTAYTHLPRISEGGIYADVMDIPKFAVPSMRKGEMYMGKILSGERWSTKWGYVTPFDFRLASNEIMHGFFTGESRSGKTVAATRFIAEMANKVKRENGKRFRIVCMDPKQDWRILSKFIEPERFHFYSLGNPEFLPIKLNICKVPKNVYPQQWVDGLIEIYCRAYGLGERGKSVLAETFYELYEEAGVFVPEWRDVAPERSSQVTLTEMYKRMVQIKLDLEDPQRSGKGRVGNDVRDAYARVLDRMQVFGRPFSIEHQLFGTKDGQGIDDLIGEDDVVILESYGLESTFKNFVFGAITSGFFKYAQGHEGGFKAADQYETILVIEEANEVLVGQDTQSGGNSSPMSGQSEFERILDQSAGLGMFVFSITQKISDMPSSVIANSGLVFAGKISREDDVKTVIRKIGREERYDDRDLLKWFPRSPIGWFVCRSSRNFDFKEVEPVLVKVEPLDVNPPTNEDLLHMMAIREARKQQQNSSEEKPLA